ncbi:hypothetical protein QYF61_024625 [Mycteria americana]|uniref:Uncharacterized protein n=1 Tax=Mycteria americana TaxID=33587 RepID=A0AAN7NNR0_MYCAM|nr:hypothetical protein QYF61_024625 [Mycteria americana]
MRLQCRPAAREQHTLPLRCVMPQLSATQKPPSLAHPGNRPGSCIRLAGTQSSKQAVPAPGTCYLQGLELQEGNWKPELKKEAFKSSETHYREGEKHRLPCNSFPVLAFRDGDFTTSLGSRFQFLTTLSVKTFFLISHLNLPWHNLRPFPLAKQPQFPQPLPIRLVLQTLHQLHCPSLDMLQHLSVFLVAEGPKLNTVFEVRPHQ